MLRCLFILLFYLPGIISISIELSIMSHCMLLLYGHINSFILGVFGTFIYIYNEVFESLNKVVLWMSVQK